MAVTHSSRRLVVERLFFFFALGSALVSSLLVSLFSPLYGLLGIGVLIGLAIAWLSVYSLRKFVFLLLVTKPLIDLTWRWRFFRTFDQGVNVQTFVALLVILVTGLALILRRKQVVLDVKGILLLAVATLAVLITPTSWAVNELVRLYAGVSFLFTAGVVLSRVDTFNKFAKYFILAVSVPVFLSLLQRAGVLPFEYWDWIEGQIVGRASGTYQHPLGLIYFLIYAIPLCLYLLSYSQLSRLGRLALWIFIPLSLLATVFTYHRTGLVVLGMELWLWMALTKKYGRAALLIVLGILAALWLRDWLQVPYGNVVDIFQGEVAPSSGEFLRGRGMNWYLFLSSLFESHPIVWLFGRGGSVAEGWVPHFGFWSSNEPHNDFIRILHAYGLFGLGLYLLILFSFFQQGWRLRNQKTAFARGLGNVMVVVLVAIGLLSITTEPMRYPTGAWYLFAPMSVVKVQYRQARKGNSAKGEKK